MPGETIIPVVAAVIRHRNGRVLVASRAAGKSLAGMFEFPGGKLKPGEDAFTGLQRELREELGIELTSARRLIQYPYAYPDKTVQLEFWLVEDFDQDVEAREGQDLKWVDVPGLLECGLLPADASVITAMQLPTRLAITPDLDDPAQVVAGTRQLLAAGYTLVQFRQTHWDGKTFRACLERLLDVAGTSAVHVMPNCPPEIAIQAGCKGLHLNAHRLRNLKARPEGLEWLSASVHDADEIRKAEQLGVDFLLLGPVQSTATHPAALPMGWKAFASLANSTTLPVFALGGLAEEDLQTAWSHGAQGIAAITAFWEAGSN